MSEFECVLLLFLLFNMHQVRHKLKSKTYSLPCFSTFLNVIILQGITYFLKCFLITSNPMEYVATPSMLCKHPKKALL